MAKYLKVFQNYENDYIDEGDFSTPSKIRVHKSTLMRPMLLLNAISFKREAEVLQKQKGIEKYDKDLIKEKINTAKYIERLKAKYKKEEDRRAAVLRKEAATNYTKLLQKYKDAKKEELARAAKVAKNPELNNTLPVIVVPEHPKKVDITPKKPEKRVIKFTQHIKADLNDLK